MIDASSNFKRAWLFALRWEGGSLENVSGDHGGLTKFGVDQASHPHVNIRALTADQAGQIYHDDEWTRCQCDKLPDDLAVALFDFAMNAGCGPAVRLLQETLRLQADGFLGPITLANAQNLGKAPYVVPEFLDRRAAFYRGIAAAHADQAQFLRGWLNRVNALRQLLAPVGQVSGKKPAAAASGGTAAAALLAVPLAISVLVVGLPSLAEANLSLQTVEWIGGLVGFLAIVKLVMGIMVDTKKLKASEQRTPQPLVVTPQPMFVTTDVLRDVDQQLKKDLATLDKYVHESIHAQAREIQGVAALIKASDEEHRDAVADINRQGEERIGKVHERLNAIDRSIGALTQSSSTTDALAAEVRQTLNTILQRLPRQGGTR